MKRALPLAIRIFLFSFIPLGLTLAGSFIAMNAAIGNTIRASLQESLRRTDAAFQKTDEDAHRQTARMIAVLSDSPELKAGMALLQETSQNIHYRDAVRQTLEEQLRPIREKLELDVLAISDVAGSVIASLPSGAPVRAGLRMEALRLGASALREFQGASYELTSVPLNLGAENIGSLVVGNKLDIGEISRSGDSALLHNGKLLLTTFSASQAAELRGRLGANCGRPQVQCEVTLGSDSYLGMPMHRTWIGSDYQLINFQSVDSAVRPYTAKTQQIFVALGSAGLLITLLISVWSSHSISRPVTRLAARLRASPATGMLLPRFETDSPVREVNLLAGALNTAAVAMREEQSNVERAYVELTETISQALDARDPYTAGHSTRVSDYATAIAMQLDLPREQVELIRIGAQLHDIGKIGVSDAILQKPGPLNSDEFSQIKRHPRIGKQILENVRRFDAILPIIECHHENHSGNGYPSGLKGHEIPIEARIVHVADAYDAMHSNRAYRNAMPFDRIASILKECSGSQFDPEIVDAFLAVLAVTRTETLKVQNA